MIVRLFAFSDINFIMSSKSKRVTYKNPEDENADYLVPLQYNPDSLSSNRTKSTKKESSAPSGYCGSINLLITILLYAGVAISQFVIGFVYIGRCTIRQFIPIYMILSGFFGITFVGVGIIVHVKKNIKSSSSSSSYNDPKSNSTILKILIPIYIFLFLCVFGWWIAGQVIVFQVKLRVEFSYPDLPQYCHGNLYKAAWVLIFVNYLLGLIAIILAAISCVSPPERKDKRKPKDRVRRPRK